MLFMDVSFTSIIDLLGFVQGTLLGLILIFSYRRNKAIPLLGIFLFAYSFELISTIANDTGFLAQHPVLLFLPIEFYWLFMPALYLYTKSITVGVHWKKDYVHFIPAILEFIIFSTLFLFPVSTKIKWTSDAFIHNIHLGLSVILILTYIILTIQLINRHKKKMEHYYSSIQGKTLRWIKWICYYVLFTLFIVPSFGFTGPEIRHFTYPSYSIINVIFIFWVALSGFKQVFLMIPEEVILTTNTSNEPIVSSIPHAENITNHQKDYEDLVAFMKKEQIYTNAHLTLSKLAEQFHYSPRKLSNLINEQAGVNFNQFVNQFRVETAKALLVNPDMAHLNLLGIAFEVGFNSKTSFYTKFKQETGYTPNQYKKLQLAALTTK